LLFRLVSCFPSRHGAASMPVFTRLPASALLSLAWPRESRQREGHPTLAPYAQSLCSGYARQLRGSLTVHPWTGIELAHIVWAILRTFPAQPRRDRGDPDSAHRARKNKATACGNSLCLGCAGCAVTGSPMQRQRGVGIARRVGARDCAQFDASPGMDCRRTSGVTLRSRRAGCPETAVSGWPFSWLLLFTSGSCPPPCGLAMPCAPLLRRSGHAKRSDSLAARRVISRHECRAPKERNGKQQIHGFPAWAQLLFGQR
jgi:hypothetical protein